MVREQSVNDDAGRTVTVRPERRLVAPRRFELPFPP